MSRDLSWFWLAVFYIAAGYALQLSVQYLLKWRRQKSDRASLWLGGWSAVLGAALVTCVLVLQASPSQMDAAVLLRALFLYPAVVLMVPTAAAFAGQRPPWIAIAFLGGVAVTRIVLVGASNLIYAHRVGPDGAPVYGPLVGVLALPALAITVLTLAWIAYRWSDRFERALFLAAFALGLGIVFLSFTVPSAVVDELLTGYWMIPAVVVLQAISIRRTAVAERAERRLAAHGASMTEQLARTDRLSRLALQSGGMGWYQFDAATGVVSASDELGSILGLPSNMRSARLDAFLGFVAAEDREGVLAAIEQAQLAGHGANEFRWQRPDGEEIWLETTARRFDEADASSQLVGVAKEVTDRKRTEAELRHQASHDPLTGLANRAALLDELKGSLQRGDQVCLLLVDLDGFKDINDSLGHPVGDRVLTQVTRRFHQQLRGGDLLARIGGDEFAVVVHDEIAGAGVLAQNLLSCLALPITLGGVAMNVRASIGISAGGVHGADPHTLLRRADAAMYRAKSRGGAWQVYEPADEASTTRRLELAARLPEALRESELKVEFQPILHVSSGQVARVEALVRWQHPRHGLIMPSEFVPLAEHHGLGSRLFHYVLAHALAQCARWRAEELADIVAVNVSAQTLTSDSFVSALKDALTAAEVPAQALMLELTEESFVKEGPVLKRSIQQVRELGIQVAIDDFGTGYSSLAYLKQLPADCVKLDGTFTSDLSRDSASDAIVGLAIDLAHRLGLTVVTEGVESAAALEALRNLGSDFAQGYLIGLPQDGAALTSALREQRWGA